MNQLDIQDVTAYVENNIGNFHSNRLAKLEDLQLLTVLARKNPYLFRAKNMATAESFVRNILDAYLSSQEETIFGDFLEGLAIHINEKVHRGYKPLPQDFEGIDLIFDIDRVKYIVEIKSGPKRSDCLPVQLILWATD